MNPLRTHYKVVLAVSLLLNVFLIGGVAGGLYQWLGQPEPAVAMPMHGLRQALDNLPQARRHELRQLMRETRQENQALLTRSRQARQEVIRLLQAPTLERTALDAALASAREADSALRARVDASVAQFAASLPAEERQQLAASLYPRAKEKKRAAN